eukprot:scaffold5237_cov170-Ochromonas_danica.AAC.10
MAEFENVVITEEELVNGFSAEDIFTSNECIGITFDDLIALPGAIDFGVTDVDLSSQVTRNFSLNFPLCSTPMDTVTEHDMAIGMALNGGVGFIHCNCTIEQQVAMLNKVKNYENGFILEPAVMSPDATIKDLDELRRARKISGVPVTVDGKMGSKLVGLISNRDTDFLVDRSLKIGDLMTPADKLVVGQYPLTIAEANQILRDSKKGYLPVVDKEGNLKALTTRTDLKKNRAFPMASKDAHDKLLVGAAVRAGSRDTIEMERILSLYKAGCNILVLDAQNGDCDVQINLIRDIKKQCPGMDIVAGNVVRVSQAKALIDAGADAIRVGMGVGSIATTQMVKAVGRPQLSSIYACARFARAHGVPVIADGGIKNTGCLIKALSIGANTVMMGALLAGVDESPGDYFYQNGVRLKNYRANYVGKGLRHDNSHHSEAAYRVSSGVSGTVVDKGPLNRYIPYLCQSIRHGLQDMGIKSLTNLREALHSGELRFELRSMSAQREGGVHDLHSFQQRLFA